MHHRRSRLFRRRTNDQIQKNQRSNATLGQSALAGDKSGDGKAISDVDWNARIRGMADELKIADNSFQTYDLLGDDEEHRRRGTAGFPASQTMGDQRSKTRGRPTCQLVNTCTTSRSLFLALLTQYQVAEQEERKDSPLPQQIAAIANAVRWAASTRTGRISRVGILTARRSLRNPGRRICIANVTQHVRQ